MTQQKRSQRLGLVLGLIDREEEAERRALGEWQAKIKRAENQVSELVNYQRIYQEEFRKTAEKRSSVNQIQSYHLFIGRLGVAIEQQEQQIQAFRQRLDQQRQKWQRVHQKKSKMADLIARCRNEEQKIEDKKEQRQWDDMAAQRGAMRRPNGE